ncbi:putative mitochondrial L-Lysine transport protein,L-Lysine transport protein (AAT16) [Leptomonas pyrrhocoris]|uniref:Putative mitochondrial L-Lysine transport protein,L-Lysine transport protein (AAT16) n=1 Tax=Leptomonas pyrrhocoris TaxID=157538 RepID=A0A0N0DZ47_LEPPY|nr:putative mitochondrial L-Lysine transport protein,L-Lysine transport protein (AAT16) [Leptomonas pyrrhocoris]XP_015663312.1 putative mitochondrial L-Lysine transport protein,L-Lysine transport protein (AAT16) [Leptomonas pyrrhocoris]KPA84872.1 putative mitochondrial L-Lysine transport protein,L-Lysine transport protein (AAT16) [Leptomonas pyrrhocoris]KPA84873.1 putative mitochondrial L-Lysine transport protein,L-Lysine transport protein (AAT16) [Leptomonas pyrrhocoris]|eukprot:XP_015663311.1 putative mitochondrial L-Lysine transport protein,L-Lysine transport protein (AAT16) [Leptomonas pyrrhocoris]
MNGNDERASGDRNEPLSDDLQLNYSSVEVRERSSPVEGTITTPTKGVDGDLEESSTADSNDEPPRRAKGVAGLYETVTSVIPHGGLVANIYNLASATLGAGIVSVPSGFRDSGVVVAVVLLVVVCACTIYSIYLLGATKLKTGLRSYEEMARGLLGRGWDYFTAFLMFMFCWGTCVGYVISVGDLLSPMLDTENTNAFLKTANGHRILVGLIWLVGMFTLSLPKEINSLRYASVVGVSFVVFFVICMIIHSAQNGLKHGLRSDIILANNNMPAVNGLSLFIFAFLCQVNVFEVFDEMRKPTLKNITRDATISMILVALLNFFSGVFGYLDFGDAVDDSILLLYRPLEDPLFMISYIGLCIKLCVGFAICIQPSRDAIYYCLHMGKTSDVKDWVNWMLSGFLALTALLCGLFIPSINIVFSLLGGICGGFIAFIFPAFFFIYSGGFTLKKVGILHYIGCIVLIVGGVVALVFGTAVAIYSKIP